MYVWKLTVPSVVFPESLCHVKVLRENASPVLYEWLCEPFVPPRCRYWLPLDQCEVCGGGEEGETAGMGGGGGAEEAQALQVHGGEALVGFKTCIVKIFFSFLKKPRTCSLTSKSRKMSTASTASPGARGRSRPSSSSSFFPS